MEFRQVRQFAHDGQGQRLVVIGKNLRTVDREPERTFAVVRVRRMNGLGASPQTRCSEMVLIISF